MNYNVTAIPGDGIGPEIVREARKVLDQVGRVYGHSFHYTEVLMGCLLYTSGLAVRGLSCGDRPRGGPSGP